MRDEPPLAVQLLRIAVGIVGAGAALVAWLATVAAGLWLDVTLPGGLLAWGPAVLAAAAGALLVRHRATVVPAARRAWADRPSWPSWADEPPWSSWAGRWARPAALADRLPSRLSSRLPRRVRS